MQVIFQAHLYISGMPFLIPGIWNGSLPMPQPQHAHWFTPPLRSSWNQPLLNLLPQPSFHHGPLQSIFHHIPVFSCKLLAGTAARPASLFPAPVLCALPGLGLHNSTARAGFPLSISSINFLSLFFRFLSSCFPSLFWFLKKLRKYNVSKI